MTELEPWRNGKKGKESNPSEECHRYLRNRNGQFDYMGAKAANSAHRFRRDRAQTAQFRKGLRFQGRGGK